MSSSCSAALLVALPLLAACGWAAQDGRTLLASVDGGGGLAPLGSDSAKVSADGRLVVFTSAAGGMVTGDANQCSDVFLRDTWTGHTIRVSVSATGGDPNGPSTAECISFDGRFVGFSSFANNLVSGDTNRAQDVFIHDRRLGTTERVSVATGGRQASARSLACSISGNGRFVAFASDADDLVPEDTNAKQDIFLRDRTSKETRRISVDSQQHESNGSSQVPSISRDGNFVTFSSYASNLIPEDTNARSDVFVRDLFAGRTARVSTSSTGAEGNDASWLSCISADGNVVAFQSLATNLVSQDTNGCDDIFVRDIAAGTTTRVSVDSAGYESRGADVLLTCLPSLSGDGRWVAFHSCENRLVEGDTNSECDVFVHDILTGETVRSSVSSSDVQGNRASINASICDDGRFVVYQSAASNLLGSGGPHAERLEPGDDVFLRERYASLGTPYCFGDGSEAECPCGNSGVADEGCDNSTGQGGFLTAIGSGRVSADDLVLVAARLPANRAATLLAAGTGRTEGVPFNDGLRCIDSGAVRLGTVETGSDGVVTWGPGLRAIGGWGPGTVRHFQVWYDDPIGPCGTGHNQTNAFEITFIP